jgi:glycosyltransferase involved in cell wall biosynthesis
MKILFYSSVSDISQFKTHGFYVEDIEILKSLNIELVATNSILDFVLLDYDISILYFYKKSLIPALISKIRRKKIYFTGGIDDLSNNIEINRINKLIFKLLFVVNYLLSNACNIVSKEDMNNVSNLLKSYKFINLNKLEYFPHSIDLFNYKISESILKENIIISICWMKTLSNVKRKGLDKTIELFIQINKVHPEYKLYLVGSLGEGSDYLKEIIHNNSIEESVIFTGFIDEKNKIELLSKSKFYFQLSNYEGFGIAVIEAMALNNFIFHTGVGGLNDTIGDRGYLVKDFCNFQDALDHFNYLNLNYDANRTELELNYKFVIDNYSREIRANYFNNLILEK